MFDAYALLDGLIRTILNAATLDFGSMSYAHTTLNGLIITTVMSTTFDLGTMFHTNTSRLGLISASINRAIGMSSSTLFDLGSMALT